MIKLSLFVLLASGLSAVAQSSGTFVTTGSMTTPRAGHTATLLKDGRVLITGGSTQWILGWTSSAELYDPGTGSFTATGSMTTNRAWHTATLLSDGRVLVAGDYLGDNRAELYDPATGRFTPTENMADVHGSLVSNLLGNGKVLVTGAPSAELYDPASEAFTRVGNIDQGTGAVVLKEDRVVIVGGEDISLYDVTNDSLKLLARWSRPKIFDPTATLLANGKVLLSGGDADGFGRTTTVEAALYDPRRGTIDQTGRLLTSRTYHTGVLLPGGRVFIYGGFHKDGDPTGDFRVADAEEYDPDTGSSTYSGTSAWIRGSHTATLLLDGTVLIAGGTYDTAAAELYIPPLRAGSAASLTGPLAPESLASLFGSRLALTTENADPLSPPPTSLGGISLRIVDSSGTARLAPLLYVSPSQINFEVPAGTAPGKVALEVVNAPAVSKTTAQVNPTAPGLFAYDDNTVIAYGLRFEPNGKQTVLSVRNTIMLDDRPVYLIAYATGIRNCSSVDNVRCTVGGMNVPVEYAGPEGSGVPGLDQVNLRLTPNLKGLGVADLACTVDGISSNTVSTDIK